MQLTETVNSETPSDRHLVFQSLLESLVKMKQEAFYYPFQHRGQEWEQQGMLLDPGAQVLCLLYIRSLEVKMWE